MESRDQRQQFVKAVQAGDLETVTRQLDAGASPDSRSALGEPVLCLAAARGDIALLTLLLDRGADPGRSSDQGNHPLMEAAARGHYDAATLLLDHGADPAAGNKWGLTARDWARWAQHPEEIIGLIASRRP